MKTSARRTRHKDLREDVRRSNRPIRPLLETMMVQPKEFALRIRKSLAAGRSPRRLLKCIDDVQLALAHRGIKMPAYFAALRREAARAMQDQE